MRIAADSVNLLVGGRPILSGLRSSIFSKSTPLQVWHLISLDFRHPSWERIRTSSTLLLRQDIYEARSYCSNLLRKFDAPSYTLQTFIPLVARDAYLSIRAINIELARIPYLTSNHNLGALRMQFWRDSLEKTFSQNPPREPVSTLLHHALTMLRARHSNTRINIMKTWLLKIIDTREKYMDNRPYTDMAALETYAENTYSTLMYLTLASLSMDSIAADHLVSHIGKAMGIAAVLRNLPLIAFPLDQYHDIATLGSYRTNAGCIRQGAVLIPLAVMAETGVREEDVLRQGTNAPGLRDAIFKIATRANDHLITTRDILSNLQKGKEINCDFEHEDSRLNHDTIPKQTMKTRDLDRLFGALLPAVSTQLWLDKLEHLDFDIFHPHLLQSDWKLPWKAYWAYYKRMI